VQLVDGRWSDLVLSEFAEHGLQAFFELAAELGSGEQAAVSSARCACPLSESSLTGDDALRGAFDDGGLADTADRHGVVLGAAAGPGGAADFFVATDDGSSTQAGALGEVNTVFLQCLAIHRHCSRLAAAYRVDIPEMASALLLAVINRLLSASAGGARPAMNWSPRA
jgi:hypothetical protein